MPPLNTLKAREMRFALCNQARWPDGDSGDLAVPGKVDTGLFSPLPIGVGEPRSLVMAVGSIGAGTGGVRLSSAMPHLNWTRLPARGYPISGIFRGDKKPLGGYSFATILSLRMVHKMRVRNNRAPQNAPRP